MKRLEVLNEYAPLIGSIIAVVAAYIAVKQLRLAKTESRVTNAKQIYKEYLLLAINNPTLSSPYEENYLAIKQKKIRYEKYEFYVSYMLFASEEILELTEYDFEWEETLKTQIKYHYYYLNEKKKDKIYFKMYSDNLNKLIKEAIDEES